MQLTIHTDGMSLDAAAILLVERFVEAITSQLGAPIRLIRVSLRAIRGTRQVEGKKRCNLSLMLANRLRLRVSESAQDMTTAIAQAFCELSRRTRTPTVHAITHEAPSQKKHVLAPKKTSP